MQSAIPQRGGEVNLTLGGIDLNNSGRYWWFCCVYVILYLRKYYNVLYLNLQCRR